MESSDTNSTSTATSTAKRSIRWKRPKRTGDPGGGPNVPSSSSSSNSSSNASAAAATHKSLHPESRLRPVDLAMALDISSPSSDYHIASQKKATGALYKKMAQRSMQKRSETNNPTSSPTTSTALGSTSFAVLKMPGTEKAKEVQKKGSSSSSSSEEKKDSDDGDDHVEEIPMISNDDCNDDDDDDFHEAIQQRPRTIKFADESNLPLVQCRVINSKDDPYAAKKVIMMLLCPKERKFEFLQAEYRVRERTSVADVVEQIPCIANNPLFRNMSFTKLIRAKDGTSELENTRQFQEYELEDGELLIAIVEGYTSAEMSKHALPLLLNGKISEAVEKAKGSKKNLRFILSSKAYREEQEEEREKIKQRLFDSHVNFQARESIKERLEQAQESLEQKEQTAESDIPENDSDEKMNGVGSEGADEDASSHTSTETDEFHEAELFEEEHIISIQSTPSQVQIPELQDEFHEAKEFHSDASNGLFETAGIFAADMWSSANSNVDDYSHIEDEDESDDDDDSSELKNNTKAKILSAKEARLNKYRKPKIPTRKAPSAAADNNGQVVSIIHAISIAAFGFFASKKR